MTVSEQSRVAETAGKPDRAASRRWSVRGWADALRVYRQPRLIAILFMGFSSGLPLALTFGTLSYWLAEIGVSLTAIGLFGLVRTSYSLKFMWSPLIDRMPIPFLTARLGRRRSWALVIQFLLALAILALGMTDPRVDAVATALAAVVVAFLSASQDIVIDAYRIELLRPDEQGAGAAATQWGYRFGLLASGAGALYAASYGGWTFAYALMAALMLVGMVTVCLTPEPGGIRPPEALPGPTAWARIQAWLGRAVVSPFYEMYERAGGLQLAAIAVFIVLFKFGDALAASMSNPLYVALEFTKVEVATISKVYGVIATLVGVAAGGLLAARIGVFRALLIGGGLQALSNLMYAVQFWAGHDVAVLTVTIAAENVTGGMASAAFVAYLSNLCSREFTATQYALLSSLATVGLNVLAASGGALAEALGWIPFFVVCTLFCAPALLLLLWLMRRPIGVPVAPA
ncbi:MAG: AmpG family muropeptide MFS transporter [Alphaproteobacteria bacterium]|nr:MAG: AmpG family muropeptide MFS transporter [Alphaproteobacteria bacterium]